MDDTDDILGGAGSNSPPAKTYDPKQDAIFVMAYVETGDPLVALMRAGIQEPDCSLLVTADRYLQRAEIRAMLNVIADLQRRTAPVKITRESLIESLHNIEEKAVTDRQYGSSISAIKMQAALLGLLEQKVTITHTYNVKEMSDAELDRIIAGGSALEGEYRKVIDADQSESA